MLFKKIQDIAEKVQAGNIEDLQVGLKQFKQIPRIQIQAAKEDIQYPIVKLVEAIDRNVKANQQEIQTTQKIPKVIQESFKNVPVDIKRSIGSVINNIQAQAQILAATNAIGKQIKKNQQLMQQRLQKQMGDPMKLDPIRTSKIQIQKKPYMTPIQQSVERFMPVLDAKVPIPTKPDQIPNTMKLLSVYSQIQGRIPIGTVTNQLGNSYVGIRSVDRGDGVQQFHPYQQNQIQKTSIPSIPMHLQYYANKTINSWNNYVRDQSNFINYISKINTSQNRHRYVSSQMHYMNLQTFSAEVLASLIFYYVFLPLQRFTNSLASQSMNFEATLNNFLQTYSVGDSPKVNPLLLNNNNGKVLATMLFQLKGKPTGVLAILKQTLTTSLKSTLNSDEMKKVIEYTDKKVLQARQFMVQNGCQQDLIKKFLATSDWSGVKKRRFTLQPSFQNPQIIEMAKQVILKDNNQIVDNTFSLQWSASQVICYDYIWKWKSY